MATKKTKKAPARKTKQQHTPDYYPIVRNIPLGNSAGLGGTTVVDTARNLSIVNRRMYRFGKKYQVKIDLDPDHTIGTTTEFEVYALANNWDVQRAFALARETYEKAMKDEREVLNGKTARWEDFRVFHGVDSAVIGLPVTNARGTLSAVVQDHGSFNDSQVDVGGVTTTFSWGASAGNILSLIEEWDLAGQTDKTPDVTEADAPYSGVNSDELNAVEYVKLRTFGNEPPYNRNTDGDVWIKVGVLYVRRDATPTTTSGISRTSTGFFDAPCGLVVLKSTGPANVANGAVRLTVKAGDYNGVHAESMCQEMEEY